MGIKSTLGRSGMKLIKAFRERDIGEVRGIKQKAQLNFEATGGQILNPGDGFKYHVFEPGTSDNFVVVFGSNVMNVAVQGGGGAGQGGDPGPDNRSGGGGGDGGATVVVSQPIAPGTYPVSVGDGATLPGSPSTGGSSTFVTPLGTITANGGGAGGQGPAGGGSGSIPYSPNPTVTVDYNITGNDGVSKNTGPPSSHYQGQAGGGSGGSPPTYNPTWWKPYLGPGTGAPPHGHGSNNPDGVYKGRTGNNYGGGGSGGSGSAGSPTSNQGAPGGDGAPGRIVVRYSQP